MDNRAWIKAEKLDLSSTFPALKFVAICHIALHTFHACSCARWFAPELGSASPVILAETAAGRFLFPCACEAGERKLCAAMRAGFPACRQTFPAR